MPKVLVEKRRCVLAKVKRSTFVCISFFLFFFFLQNDDSVVRLDAANYNLKANLVPKPLSLHPSRKSPDFSWRRSQSLHQQRNRCTKGEVISKIHFFSS